MDSTTGNKHLFLVFISNEYKFVAKAENDSEFKFNAESGQLYYIEQKPKLRLITTLYELVILKNEDGIQKPEKCSVSTKFTPPAF